MPRRVASPMAAELAGETSRLAFLARFETPFSLVRDGLRDAHLIHWEGLHGASAAEPRWVC